MKLTNLIKNIFNKNQRTEVSFIFPYSTDNNTVKVEIWKNLENGLLIEDKQILLAWKTSHNLLNHHSKKEERSDRTTWYFQDYKILNGFQLNFETIKWKDGLNRKFDYVSSIINEETAKKIINHLTKYIGIPDNNTLDFESKEYSEGQCEWTKNNTKIKIYNVEFHGGFTYKIKIGTTKSVDEYV